MANRHILIVGDLELMRQMLMAILDAEGYRVQTAATGWEALDAVARTSFDLILADLDMPLPGGGELAQALQQRYARTPVIAMSVDPARLTREGDLRVAAVIEKPFTAATLLALIHDVFQGTEKPPADAAHDRPA